MAGSGRRSAPEIIAALSWRHPVSILVLSLVLVSISIAGILRLSIDTSTSSFLDRKAPEWAAYQRSLRRHGGDEFLVVALEAPEPWHYSTLADVVRLSALYAQADGVRRVDSLATVPLIRSEANVLFVDSGLAKGVPSLGRNMAAFQSLVRDDRIAADSLVSDDGRFFAINLLLDSDVDRPRDDLVRFVRESVVGKSSRITGVPVFRTEVNSRTASELALFVPITICLLALVVAIFLPSPIAVLLPLAVGGISALVALGIMGFLGVSLALSTTVLPSMLLAIGCAYAMHVVSAPATELSMAEVASPVVLSGMTTTIGFLAMATVPIRAIQELSTFGALGVCVATIATVSLGPAAISLAGGPKRIGRTNQWLRVSAPSILQAFVVRSRSRILVLWLVAIIFSVFGLLRLNVSTDIILWFPAGTEVRDDYEAVREHLSGITPVNVLIEPVSDDSDDLHSASIVRLIAQFSDALEQRHEVGKVLSIVDPLLLTKRAFADGQQVDLPQSDAEVEQLLLLLSGVDRLDDVLHRDRRSANLLLRIDDNASDEVVGLAHWISEWWSTFGSPEYRVTTTGIMYEFGRAEEAIAQGQIHGLALAAAAIGLILLVFLRNLRLSVLALVSNLVPIILAFGAMGLLSIPLDAATVCLGSMALGIAVDDTIHLISAFQRHGQGLSRREALGGAISRVLPALVMTTASISIGFAVLVFSSFSLIGNLGAVTAVLVVVCLFADLTLLPAVLVGGQEKSVVGKMGSGRP